MRAREFLMKDSYSFHVTDEDLGREYQNMYDTYGRIFTRLGLKFRAVSADSGAIGGAVSHEFQVLADSGEDAIYDAAARGCEGHRPQRTSPCPSSTTFLNGVVRMLSVVFAYPLLLP